MSVIDLPLEGAEPEVVLAALMHYGAFLAKCRDKGGDAESIATAFSPVVTRLAARLSVAMYEDDPQEPEGLDVAAGVDEPINVIVLDLAAGDHFVYPEAG